MSSKPVKGEKGVYDIIIVGGGIYGAVIARECARSGLSTILVEKDGFCEGSSVNSLNILHGGLRYLQHLNLRRMRRSVYSRHYFQQFSPDLIDIIPFLMPLNGWGLNGPMAMKSALLLNDLLSIDRNRGIDLSQRIPGGHIKNRHVLLEALPGLKKLKFSSAAIWYEAVMNDPAQLLTKLLNSAADSGARILSQTDARELRTHQGKITGLRCYRKIDNRELTISGNIVIDTSGRTDMHLGSILPGYRTEKLAWARGTNMLINKNLFGNYAAGLKHKDNVADKEAGYRGGNRYLFFVPTKNGTAIGTFYEHEKDVEGKLAISNNDQKKYRDAINAVLPRGKINKSDVIGWNSGWLPLDEGSTSEQMNFVKSSQVRAVESSGNFSGLIEVRSVKFTTAPAVAKDIMGLLKSFGY